MEVSYGREIALTARIWFLDAQSVSFQNPAYLLMHVYVTVHYVMKKWETFPRPLQRAVWAQQHHQSLISNLIPICSIYFSLFVLYQTTILSNTYSYDDLTTIISSQCSILNPEAGQHIMLHHLYVFLLKLITPKP